MLGVRSWLTPMHNTSSLAWSFFFARFSPICVGMAGPPAGLSDLRPASRASPDFATARTVCLWSCRSRDVEAKKYQYGPHAHQREGDGGSNLSLAVEGEADPHQDKARQGQQVHAVENFLGEHPLPRAASASSRLVEGSEPVTPAEAGVQGQQHSGRPWIPACTAMTTAR